LYLYATFEDYGRTELGGKFFQLRVIASSKLALALKKASSGVICFSSIQITIYQSQK
jgi:hypothetical protein